MTDIQHSKLLLVDDDEIFSEVLAEALEDRGFHVQIAHSLDHANQRLRQETFEYAVLDLRIDQETGLELIKPTLTNNPQAKIVVLTGYASIATAVEAIKLGATHYLTKPANADDVIAALHKLEGDEKQPVQKKPPSVKRLEWDHLQKVLMENDGNISATARALNMHRRTLQRKLQKKPVKD